MFNFPTVLTFHFEPPQIDQRLALHRLHSVMVIGNTYVYDKYKPGSTHKHTYEFTLYCSIILILVLSNLFASFVIRFKL